MSAASTARLAMLVYLADHFGVEPAADHDEEEAAVSQSRIQQEKAAGGDGLAKLFGFTGEMKVFGEQVGSACSQKSDRDPRFGAVGQFRRGAVSAGADQGPEPPLAVQQIGPRRNLGQVGHGFDLETGILQALGQPFHATGNRTATCFWIDGYQYVRGRLGEQRREFGHRFAPNGGRHTDGRGGRKAAAPQKVSQAIRKRHGHPG